MTLPIAPPNPANIVAQSLTGRDYISMSQITAYQTCPLRWYFHYVAALPSQLVGSSLVFGGAVHAAIEHYYRGMLTGESAASIDELMPVFDQAWKADAAKPIQFGKKETAESLRNLGRQILESFLANTMAEPGQRILGIEEELRGEIVPGLPDCLARVDLIVREDDALVVRDFKTARSRWNDGKVADAVPQLLLYGEMCGSIAQAYSLPIRLEFAVLTKARTPAIELHAVELDPFELARTKQVMQQVWHAMQTGHVYPNPSPMNCSSCAFQQPCREWCG